MVQNITSRSGAKVDGTNSIKQRKIVEKPEAVS
jgi:hypothetical protein